MTGSRTPVVEVAALEGGVSPGIRVIGVPLLGGDGGPTTLPGTPDAYAPDPGELRARGFKAKAGSSLVTGGTGGAPVVVFLGLGPSDRLDLDVMRRAGAALVRSAGDESEAAVLLPRALCEQGGLAALVGGGTVGGAGGAGSGVGRLAGALAEGALLAAYRFDAHKSTSSDGEEPAPPGRLARLVILVDGDDVLACRGAAERARHLADAVWLARDWVNEPPSLLTPSRFAELAAEALAGRPGVSIEAWDLERIRAERLGGLLGVARGSAEEPRLVRARYEPSDPVEVGGRVPHVMLVGKGITFDSGGLSLKTAGGMETMKTDMSGAAAVLSVLSACGELGVRVRVTAIGALSENMPGGRATKPGDVLVTRSGRTIEVLNTDAEGRLVLSDALTLAAEESPDAIVDLATLTGACVVALGRKIAGLFSNDEDLGDRLSSAAEASGEHVWRLPLPEDYRDHIDSDVADMKNVGKAGEAGAIAGAMLLERFVEGIPWAHLDIAGPARSSESSGYLAKGGTGFGVRLLAEMLTTWPEQGRG